MRIFESCKRKCIGFSAVWPSTANIPVLSATVVVLSLANTTSSTFALHPFSVLVPV